MEHNSKDIEGLEKWHDTFNLRRKIREFEGTDKKK